MMMMDGEGRVVVGGVRISTMLSVLFLPSLIDYEYDTYVVGASMLSQWLLFLYVECFCFCCYRSTKESISEQFKVCEPPLYMSVVVVSNKSKFLATQKRRKFCLR